jgi:hypothetical protein
VVGVKLPSDSELAGRVAYSSDARLRDGHLELIGVGWAANLAVELDDVDTDGPVDQMALVLAQRFGEERLRCYPGVVAIGQAMVMRQVSQTPWPTYAEYRKAFGAKRQTPGLRVVLDSRALVNLAAVLGDPNGHVELEIHDPSHAVVVRPVAHPQDREGLLVPEGRWRQHGDYREEGADARARRRKAELAAADDLATDAWNLNLSLGRESRISPEIDRVANSLAARAQTLVWKHTAKDVRTLGKQARERIVTDLQAEDRDALRVSLGWLFTAAYCLAEGLKLEEFEPPPFSSPQ